uniref:Uncharacterized protein n=1 Tax=Cuerna arida TaxID=1464854 RepID=A0A1B6GP05_9HEMI
MLQLKISLIYYKIRIPGYEDDGERDFNEWTTADANSCEKLTYGKIVMTISHHALEQNEDGSDDEALNTGHVVSHKDPTEAFDVALRYIEQQDTSTPADLKY